MPVFHQETFNATFTSFTQGDALGMNHTIRYSFQIEQRESLSQGS